MRGSVAERLRTAYAAPTLDGRLDALRSLWSEEGFSADRLYARRILTAVAAARIRPTAAVGEDIDDIVGSMLSAGLDARAAAWAGTIDGLDGEAAERAWAMLAVAAPRPIAVNAGRIGGYGDAVGDPHAGQLLLASLAGLGRIGEGAARSLADDMQVDLAAQNAWTRRDRAGRPQPRAGQRRLARRRGLADRRLGRSAGAHLYRILLALRQVGLDYEARMIAAEAIARS